MQDCHGRVAVLLLHHELCHGFAHDVRASEYSYFLTLGLNIITLEQGEYAQRGGADESRQTYGHTAHIDRVETIYVLAVIYGFGDALLADVMRQGELDYETVDVSIGIEALHRL